MNDQLYEKLMRINKKVLDEKESDYQPYRGGAGPSNEQIRKNNEALRIELGKVNIKATPVKTDLNGILEDEVDALELSPGVFIGYDRWGFVGDVTKGVEKGEKLDQGSLEDAVEWAKKNSK